MKILGSASDRLPSPTIRGAYYLVEIAGYDYLMESRLTAKGVLFLAMI